MKKYNANLRMNRKVRKNVFNEIMTYSIYDEQNNYSKRELLFLC